MSPVVPTAVSISGFLHGADRFRPSFSVRYELGNGSASLGHNTIGLRHRLPVTSNLGVEVMTLPHDPLAPASCLAILACRHVP